MQRLYVVCSIMMMAFPFGGQIVDWMKRFDSPNPVEIRYRHLIYNGYPCGLFKNCSDGKFIHFINASTFEIMDSAYSFVGQCSFHCPCLNESLLHIVLDSVALRNDNSTYKISKTNHLFLSASLDTIRWGDTMFILVSQDSCETNPKHFVSIRSFLPYLYFFGDERRTLTIEFSQPDLLKIRNIIPFGFSDIFHVSLRDGTMIVIDSLVQSSRKDIPFNSPFIMPYRPYPPTATSSSVFPLLQPRDTIYVSQDLKRLWVSHITFDALGECEWVRSKYNWEIINRINPDSRHNYNIHEHEK